MRMRSDVRTALYRSYGAYRLSISGSVTYTLQKVHFLPTQQKVGTNDAFGSAVRLGTTPIVDGGTQWMSLSAAIEKPSNREPQGAPKSIVQLAP